MTQEGPSIQDPWYLRDIVKFRNVADSTGNEVTVSPSTEVMELEPSRVDCCRSTIQTFQSICRRRDSPLSITFVYAENTLRIQITRTMCDTDWHHICTHNLHPGAVPSIMPLDGQDWLAIPVSPSNTSNSSVSSLGYSRLVSLITGS